MTVQPPKGATSEIAVSFRLYTAPQDGHPDPAYTHRCDVTISDEPLWSRWGRSAEEAEKNARWQIGSHLRRALGGR